MNLEDVYSSRVKSSAPVNFSLVSNFERDPLFANLENQVFSKFNEIVIEDSKKFENEEVSNNFGNNQIISYGLEDAIKELISFKNKGPSYTKK